MLWTTESSKLSLVKGEKKVLEAVSKYPLPCTCFCDRRVHRLGQSQEIICKSQGLGRHQDSSVKMLEIHYTNFAAAFLPMYVLKHIILLWPT